MLTHEVMAMIATRHERPEWALFEQVANGTGWHGRRYADAVAMNLYPSRGLVLHGFEVKVSKGDWKRELAQPEKSGDIQQYMDFWWIVAPPDVVDVHELPVTWGLYEAKGRGLRVVKKAPQLVKPKKLDREFAAALIRRAGEASAESLRAHVAKETMRVRKEAEQSVKDELDSRSRHYTELHAKVKLFQEQSGIDINGSWGRAKLGAAILHLFSGYDTLPGRLEDTEAKLEKALALVREARAEIGAPADVEPA